MDILERITRLPEDLRQYILKYTHKLQPTQQSIFETLPYQKIP